MSRPLEHRARDERPRAHPFGRGPKRDSVQRLELPELVASFEHAIALVSDLRTLADGRWFRPEELAHGTVAGAEDVVDLLLFESIGRFTCLARIVVERDRATRRAMRPSREALYEPPLA